MSLGLLLIAAGWHVVAREVLRVAAIGLAVSTVDDCFIDLIYLAMSVRRWRDRPHIVSTDVSRDHGWMAIVVPAWDEAAVIGAMLRDLTARLDYPCFRVFVGTYPNDPATRAAVVAVGDPRIAIIGVDRPGPTTKADCLNALWRAVVAHEAAGIM